MRRHAASVVASGFSQNTGLPAAMAASTYSSCVGPHEATRTASTSGSAISFSPLACTRASPRPALTSSARDASTSVTAPTVHPDSTVVMRRLWSCPIIPTPMTPTRTVMCWAPWGATRWCQLPWRRRPSRASGHGPEAAAVEVLAGSRGDGSGDVRLHRVHVVLDDGEQVGVEGAQLGEQRLHGRNSGRRL